MSKPVRITVHDIPAIATISAPAAVCAGNPLTLTAPVVTANGSAIIDQGWEIEATLGGNDFVAFDPATLLTYTDNGKKLRYAATNICGTVYSNIVTIIVGNPLTISDISVPDEVCVGNPLTLTVPTITTNGSIIIDQGWLLNGVAYVEGTPVTYAQNGQMLKYFAENECDIVYSNEVAIFVKDKPTIGTLTTPEAVCAGNPLILTPPTVNANGGTITNQGWLLAGNLYTGGNVTYVQNNATLRYFAVNECDSVVSYTVNITVRNTPTIANIASPEAVCSGDPLSLTKPNVTANGSPIIDQGWLLNGVAYAEGTPVTYAQNGQMLKYFAENECGIKYSNQVAISVKDEPSIANIATPEAVCSGDPLSLIAPTVTTNGGTIIGQGWLLNGIAYVEGSPVTYAQNGASLKYFVETECGITYSNEVTITVNEEPVIADITAPDAVCSGNALMLSLPNVTLTSSSTIIDQGWLLNGVVYTIGTVVTYSQNGQPLRYFIETECGIVYSNEVVITVNDKPTITDIDAPAPIFAGERLMLSAPNVSNNGSEVTNEGWILDDQVYNFEILHYSDNGKMLKYFAVNSCDSTFSNQVPITVLQHNISLLELSPIPDQIYNGTAFTPPFTVTETATGYILVEYFDFFANWSNNINVGTAMLTVSGINDYAMTLSTTFEILPAPQALTIAADTTIYVEDGPITIFASTTSGLPVLLTIDNTACASIIGTTLTPINSGVVTVTANVAHNANYQDVAPVQQVINIISNNTDVVIDVSNSTKTGDRYYVVDCGDNSVTVTVTPEEKGAIVVYKGVIGNVFDVDVSRADIYDVTFKIISSSGREKVYELELERYFLFEEIGGQKFNNLVYINNNFENNNGYRFVGYQWYKNGVAINGATNQYYSEGETVHDKLDPNAWYKVTLYCEDGKVLHTCETQIELRTLPLKAYPSMAYRGQTITVEGDIMGKLVELFSANGAHISTTLATSNEIPLQLPKATGTYIVKVESEVVKVIIK